MLRTIRCCILLVVIFISVAASAAPSVTAEAESGTTPLQKALRAYPVLPTFGSRARVLAIRGKQRGNRPGVFAKIGDSISAWSFFMVPIGQGGLRLGSYAKLEPTVNFFINTPTRTGNSFIEHSLSALDGWLSGDLIDPSKAAPGVCSAGETPVACELRVNKPSVALIMIGTNDLPISDTATFRRNLDRVLTIVESAGVIPVVSTIPYRRDQTIFEQRALAFNQVIVQVAQAHAAPLWNYWLAIEGLPANGVSTDGIHPSIPYDGNTAIFDTDHLVAGFNMRNLTGLQVLERAMAVVR
jgi:hypothetical protein